MDTPFFFARATVSRMVSSSPACPPHAILADETNRMISGSCPAPSPRSELTSMKERDTPDVLHEERREDERDRCEELDEHVQARAGGVLERVADRVADYGRGVRRRALADDLALGVLELAGLDVLLGV